MFSVYHALETDNKIIADLNNWLWDQYADSLDTSDPYDDGNYDVDHKLD